MLPHLERNLELRREYVACFEPADDPYDIVLDDYEPGMKTHEVVDDLRRVEGRAPALAARGRRCRADRRLLPARPLPAAVAAPLRARDARAVGDGPGRVAARPHRASVRDVVRADRHPAHDELPRGLAARDPLLHARVRSRDLRAAGRSGVHALAARARRVVRVPRVAEPHVGEPRRPQHLDVALLLSEAAGRVPRAVRRRLARDVPSRAEQGAAVVSAASTPTR